LLLFLSAAESDGELSGDSLDGAERKKPQHSRPPAGPSVHVHRDAARGAAADSDAMTFVSALTSDGTCADSVDDGSYSYAELHDAAEGNKKSMIPKPIRKKKKKSDVWKMQPISTKPYTHIPTTND
jgi:hypothetical protein